MKDKDDNEIEPVGSTITTSFSGKISTAQWENASPFFSFTENYTAHLSDEQMEERQKELSIICTKQFNLVAERLYQEKIAKQYKNLRFYDGKDGIKYPSVTSCLNLDIDFNTPPDELAQYGARGTIIHKQAELFLKEGKWKQPKEIPEIFPDINTMVKGNLGLTTEGYDFLSFFADYPFNTIGVEIVVLNHEHRYGGRMDIKCVIESKNKGKWDKIDGIMFDVPTILDIKTGTVDKTKHLKQQTAYAHCDSEIKQIGIIPLNNTTKQGYSKPIIETDMDKYWSLFLADRAKMTDRYGI